ncbi:hypothetical protein DI09_80p90 [Mitosporidium daphniae]|uniref:Uncharacterized protein n=1 Tax=Mitosporidium daphniae TaxID=1485682 RepID=A0A098VML7_9MICR|nr:uncharacterized protein DI09_82p100 [Mitosporidium daphniae]XP_013236657.1 uncharacterized protein DI09_80p90 [Mitosporidium daphniae]KGG50191.1 hypothetical protein DI09_82p100 [Mitosporidium daphniae]KGG50215.1 hypothetical protein DI09_80p90 [Mitosporidium daphniae]|eukprot:XP_013236618.1 uncharacterized protein DI09_82p100 [Mitosporidium daphniae]
MLRHRSCNFYSSAKKKDPYDVLGIPKSASAAAIKKAYLGLVKQFHPDTNKDPAAKEKFVEVQTAYDILSDDQKRASFDANGYQENEDSQHPDPADIFKSFFGAGRSSRPGSGSAFDPFADLFGTHAFRGTSRGGKRISEDIQMRITLTFLEAALGCVKPITLSRWEQCGTCSGSGITPGTTMATCKGCGGRGAKVFSRGGMVIEVPCDTCDGTGSHNPNPCKKCSGDGIHRSASPTPIEVRIPAGVDSSTQLVMEGMGNSMGTGSRAGNLLLQFKVGLGRHNGLCI